jgi:uncharacterized protein (UPF0548 family)
VFLLHRPSPQAIESFIVQSRDLPLSYEPLGLAQGDGRGFRVDTGSAIVGHGEAAFARARTALTEWRHFELGWMAAFRATPGVARGAVIAVLVRHLGFWSLNGCRVVYLIEGDTAFGFAYGTLTNHAESGEEIFSVSLDDRTGAVAYQIRAASRPRALPARLGYPFTRLVQARFRRDSAAAMTRAVADV